MRSLAALLPCLAAALQAPLRSRRLSTSLNILSPEAMVSLQKATNKAEFEDTVAKYAKQKRLSTRDAELEYARYLLDPSVAVQKSKLAKPVPFIIRSARWRGDPHRLMSAQG